MEKRRDKNFYSFSIGIGRKNKQAAFKLTAWLLCFAMAVGMLSGMIMPWDVKAAEAVPSIIKAQLVSDRDLEIYWDQKVTGADAAASFSVTIDGKAVEITKEPWIWDEESWSWVPGGIVCYSTRNSHYPNNPDQWKTSISLPKAISAVSNLPVGEKEADLPEIKVKITPNSIRNEAGAYVPEQTVTVDTYEPFYQQEVKLGCGVRVLGSKAVRPEAMAKAAEMLEIILANETIAKRMGDAGCMLGLYGEGEIAYDILEHRYSYDENYLYVEGFGGTQLASIKDANVLRLNSGNYRTGYPNESILAHEFGHTVQNFGLDDAQKAEFEAIYQASTGKGKWADSYAGSNSSEYFATLTAIWFNAMDDTWDGKWDGVRGPINTREELKAYDRDAYEFMSKIYVSDQYLPAPWENGTVPDNYTYVDPNQPDPDPDNPDPEYIIKAQLINARDIELYWSEEVTGADNPDNFQITVDGEANEIHTESEWEWDEQGGKWEWVSGGIVYYNSRNSYYPDNPDQAKTSFTLSKGIASLKNKEIGDLTAENLPKIEVKIAANSIKTKSGAYVPEQTVTVTDYEPLYQQEEKLACGVRVVGTKKVRPEAMKKAAEMLEVILANPDVAKRMGDAGCVLGIYGEGETAYDIIEHRYGYDEQYLYVEGFGGTQLASIKDANVLRLTTGTYKTSYPNESILSHEFGHTVQNFGLSEGQQQEFEQIYKNARADGKWDNSYAGSNAYEYFATLTAIWFNAMDDTADGKWDGVRGPINTREELKAYDRDAYEFMSKIYVSDQYLPTPWENGTVPDNYTYVDPNQPDPDKPDPDKPDPDKPDPDKPDPDKPDPDKPDPDKPDPDKPDPDKPDPDKPDPDKPDPDKPNPDKPDPDKPDPEVKTYKVKFVYYNGKKTVTKTVKEGKKVSAPTAPKREGYYFEGWYLNGKKYSFNKKVTKSLTLKAKWSQIKAPKISSVKAKKGRKAMVTFKLNNGTKINGCKITYAKDKKFKKSVKTKIISSKKATKWTTGRLSKGTYYFKVQAYRLDGKKTKIYGKASGIKKLTIK